jgi:SNF2 family DNA or RNA helicase
VKVMLGHPASAGLGVNLVEAGYSIYFSRSYNLEHSLQSEARNYRGGSKEAGHEKITVIDLVAEGTMDELVLKSLSSKEEVSLEVLKRWLNEKDRD